MNTTVSATLLSLVALAEGLVTMAVEFNRTHATNPLWPGHARFHLVWQGLTTALYSGVTLFLLWDEPLTSRRFYLVSALAAAPLLGFMVALLTRALYGGKLSDPNGVPPLRLGGSRIDGNLLAVTAGLTVILLALWLFPR